MRFSSGFSLVELMVVLAVIALLAMLSIPNFTRFVAKAKRAEAYMHLRNLYLSQKTYFIENQKYTDKLKGSDSLNWDVAKGSLYYTYGFAGQEGNSNVVGSLQAPGSLLGKAFADKNSFLICAAGDIDSDGVSDLISIDNNGKITVEVDDLA